MVVEVMITIHPLSSEFYDALYPVAVKAEPMPGGIVPPLDLFRMEMFKREGFVLVVDGQCIGCVSYSDHQPRQDITMHVFIDKKYRGLWCSRKVLRIAFSFPFIELGLPRCSGLYISGINSETGVFLSRLGFKMEGVKRNGFILNGRAYNIVTFGMLLNECRWLKI